MELIQYSDSIHQLNKKLIGLIGRQHDYTEETKKQTRSMLETLNTISENTSLLVKLIDEARNVLVASAAQQDIAAASKKHTEYVYHIAGGILDHGHVDLVSGITEKIQLIPELKYRCKIQTIIDNTPIPQAFYFDPETSSVWCNVAGNKCRVPFMPVVDAKVSRANTSKCKYRTRANCAVYNNYCNFVHTTEQYSKIGYPVRCGRVPCIGTPDTFVNDIGRLTSDDAQTLLMYGLHDVFCAYLYFTHNSITGNVYAKLDRA